MRKFRNLNQRHIEIDDLNWKWTQYAPSWWLTSSLTHIGSDPLKAEHMLAIDDKWLLIMPLTHIAEILRLWEKQANQLAIKAPGIYVYIDDVVQSKA